MHGVIATVQAGLTDPKQEGELGVPVVDVPRLAVGDVHQGHDHIAKSGQRLVDAASLL